MTDFLTKVALYVVSPPQSAKPKIKKDEKVKKSSLERIKSAKKRTNSALPMVNHSPLIATASC